MKITKRKMKKQGLRIKQDELAEKLRADKNVGIIDLAFFNLMYALSNVSVSFCLSKCKLICFLSSSSVETDNVVYLLSSCLDIEIRRSVLV